MQNNHTKFALEDAVAPANNECLKGNLPSIAFLTDAPPLSGKGHGCHVLAYNLISHLKPFIRVILTRRMRRELSREEIKTATGIHTLLYPDVPFFPSRFGAFKSRLEQILIKTHTSKIANELKKSGVQRLFACCGADPWFLWTVHAIKSAAKLPVDIYLVDDFESSAILHGKSEFAEKTRQWERRILPQCERIFAISRGFCELIEAKVGVKATWLPIPIPLCENKIRYQPFQYDGGNVCRLEISYLGAINPLYIGAIKDLIKAIEDINKIGDKKIKLIIMSYTEPGVIQHELGDSTVYEILHKLPIDECRKRLEKSWLIFMPYTFDKMHSTMVSTSFPSRLAETIQRGRPLLVYGPPKASLPQYFKETGTNICVTERESLFDTLMNASNHDNSETIAAYERLAKENHSPQALAKILGLS